MTDLNYNYFVDCLFVNDTKIPNSRPEGMFKTTELPLVYTRFPKFINSFY